jgi:hypothetical protein
MSLEKLFKKLVFGTPVKGERVRADYELRFNTAYPPQIEKQSEKEWKKEFNVSAGYSRFNPTGNFYTNEKYGDESVSEHNDILRRVITGSI